MSGIVSAAANKTNALPNQEQAKTQSKSEIARKNLTGTFNDFVKIFITQLQHQDPLSPFESSEFTNSLANLSQVEQSLNTNTNLEKLISLTQEQLNGGFTSTQINNSVSYLDKNIEFTSDKIEMSNEGAEFRYVVNGDYDKVSIAIKDQAGSTIFLTEGEKNQGVYEFSWDGVGDDNIQYANGIYTLTVNGFNEETGLSEPLNTYTSGVVKGAALEEGEVVLEVGRLTTQIPNVVSVRSVE